MNTAETTDAGWTRLRTLVNAVYTDTYMTTGGIVKLKTAKQREIEKKIADEVVRFAFDHTAYGDGFLAPTGLFMALKNGEI